MMTIVNAKLKAVIEENLRLQEVIKKLQKQIKELLNEKKSMDSTEEE